MKPTLFEYGPIVIRSWGVMVALGILIGLYFALKAAKKKNIDNEKILNLTFYMILAGLIGGRIVFVLIDYKYYFSQPLQILMIQQGGLSIQGAILGGALATYLFCRYHKLSFAQIADIYAPSLLIGQAIGRIGCFLGGHCEGIVTSFFIKVKFPMLIGYRHPVQLYETALDLLAFGIILLIRDKFKKDGQLFSIVAIIMSLVRFSLDFIRAENKILLFGLSYAQIFAVLTAAVFSTYLLVGGKNELPERTEAKIVHS